MVKLAYVNVHESTIRTLNNHGVHGRAAVRKHSPPKGMVKHLQFAKVYVDKLEVC